MGTTTMSRAGQRETALLNFYRLERQSGADPVTANENLDAYAKRLADLEYQRDLEVIRQCMGRTS